MVGHSPRLRAATFLALMLTACAASARGAGLNGPVTERSSNAVSRESSPDPAQGVQSWEPARLRRIIEERYHVLPMQDGVMLVPRHEDPAVKSIEVRGDTVAVNGSAVTGAELRDRLKTDSDAILALSYLDPAARRALFEGTTKAAPPTAEASPTEPEATGREGATPPVSSRTDWRGRHSDARVHIGGPVTVAENETVDGPVVAIGGSVTVDGDVREDVVAVGGNVKLGPKARVRGDVTTVGGTIQQDPAAEIDGKTNEIGFNWHDLHVGRVFWSFPAAGFLTFGPWVQLVVSLFRMMLFALLAILVFLIAHNPVARIEQAAAVEPWKAGLVGLLTELLFLPVFILTIVFLAVSIIGIPLLLFVPPLAIVALIAAFVFGFTGVAYRVGRWAQHRFAWAPRSPFVLLLVGLAGIWALTILGHVVSLGGWPIWFVSAALLLTGFLVEYVAWTVGLGAAIMTRFGTRPAAGGGGAVPVTGAAVPTGQQGGSV
jgi:hypothetical protein